MHFFCLRLLAVALLFPLPATADMSAFTTGPAIEGYGPVASVADARPVPRNARFKVAFDARDAGEGDKPNRTLESAARFINMHVKSGVPAEHIEMAVIVHGSAHRDLLLAAARGGPNPNARLIAQLVAFGVTIELCGQTAAYYGVDGADLLPGVGMSLSAMTSHALLQQQGFTLNPF